MYKVLIVDDEKSVLDMVEDCLLLQKYEVSRAQNGQLGFEMAKRLKPDIVICDVEMPQMDGRCMLQQIRNQVDLADMPFIFLTGLDSRPNQRIGMELGADDYLAKPFAPMELLNAIKARMKKTKMIKQKYNTHIEDARLKLRHAQSYDGITNLPNHSLLKTKFEQIKDMIQMESMAVLSLSVDHFGEIESQYSLAMSHAILKFVANKINSTVGSKFDLVYYTQNNQFFILFPMNSTNTPLIPFLQTLIYKLNQPFKVQRTEFQISVSVGVSLCPLDANTLEDLIHQANHAKQKSLRLGGNQYQYYL